MHKKRDVVRMSAELLLNAIAVEHPLKHQPMYANRYIIKSHTGKIKEVMLEKSTKTPPHIWCMQNDIPADLIDEMNAKLSPASSLHIKPSKIGATTYGRHSALENMPKLGNADLVCLTPKSIADVGAIVDCLLDYHD